MLLLFSVFALSFSAMDPSFSRELISIGGSKLVLLLSILLLLLTYTLVDVALQVSKYTIYPQLLFPLAPMLLAVALETAGGNPLWILYYYIVYLVAFKFTPSEFYRQEVYSKYGPLLWRIIVLVAGGAGAFMLGFPITLLKTVSSLY